jgi:HPt (histidine-containing phosphotransfer) domain-containing protein
MEGLSAPPPPNQALADLAQLVGDDAAKEIVRLFLQSFPESIRELRASGRPDQMRIAHGLQSSALHMGAARLAQRIGEVEAKLAESPGTLDPGDLAPATAEFESFAAALRQYAEA